MAVINPQSSRAGRSSVRAIQLLIPGLCLVAVSAHRTAVPAAAQATPAYTITDLGTLGGSTSSAEAINEQGQVVGGAEDEDGDFRPFLWTRAGGLTPLPDLGGNFGIGRDINASGEVVGEATTPAGVSRAVLIKNGQLTDLFQGVTPFAAASAEAINDSGQVVGMLAKDEFVSAAFLYKNGAVTDLGNLDNDPEFGFAYATDINNKGQVVGVSGKTMDEDFVSLPVIVQNGRMTAMKTLNGPNGEARAISDAGLAAGSAELKADEEGFAIAHAASWTSATAVTDLTKGSPFYTEAHGVNAKGDVVGAISDDEGGSTAFVKFAGKNAVALNTLLPANSGWNLTFAKDINGKGQIVGEGEINGETHAFLLSPPATTTDLILGVSDTPDPALLGGQITYTINVVNTTINPVPGVTYHQVLDGATFVTPKSLPRGLKSLKAEDGVVTAEIAEVPSRNRFTFSFTATATRAGALSSAATLVLPDTIVDTNTTNNSVTVDTTVNAANLFGEFLLTPGDKLTETCSGTGSRKQCTLRGKFRTRNNGTASSGTSSVAFYLSSDNVLSTTSDTHLNTLTLGSVPQNGGTRDLTLSASLTRTATAQGKFVIAVIDHQNKVSETNENDNVVVFGPMP